MDLGIIGLPQVGKKTLFTILTDISTENESARSGLVYGACPVKDPRVDYLNTVYEPKRKRYAEFTLGLAPDIQPEAARSAEWLEALRQLDGYIHVVRAFDDPSVFHIQGDVEPRRDMQLVETEILFADLEFVEKRLERLEKEKSKRDSGLKEIEKAALEKCRDHLEEEKPLRTLELKEDELDALQNFQLLTRKPLVVVLNVGERPDEAATQYQQWVEAVKEQYAAEVVFLNGAVEAEINELAEQEREEFQREFGLSEPAVDRLSRAAFERLGLISFFTVGADEVRAWPLEKGSIALRGAGKIHSDLERGFIRAEQIHYEDFKEAGSEKAARDQNLYRLRGKDYIVQDGDILTIRFNV